MLSRFKSTILYLENLTNGEIGAGCKPGNDKKLTTQRLKGLYFFQSQF